VRKIAELAGTIAAQSHDLARLAGAVVLYDGAVREGARLYPQNVNIAAATALAGIGLGPHQADHRRRSGHQHASGRDRARGAFGSFRFAETGTERRESENRSPRRHGAGQDGAPAALDAGVGA